MNMLDISDKGDRKQQRFTTEVEQLSNNIETHTAQVPTTEGPTTGETTTEETTEETTTEQAESEE